MISGVSYESLASSCKESDAPEPDTQSHTFRCKVFKRPRPCNLCHQPIHQQGSCCRVCKYVCHKACENKHSYDGSAKSPSKNKQAALTQQPRMATTPTMGMLNKSPRSRSDSMDLSYVTERIIALWIPGDVSSTAYRHGQKQAAHMLQTKHGKNYMVFNLSEPRRAARSHHERISELGWPPDLAPPLERLCKVCKDIDEWLSGDTHRIAVLHARGSKERIGVVIAAYMHYSSICGSADQALDRFAMGRFLNDKIGDLQQPSHKRYVEYFSGLLSGNIRINAAPLYLTHVTVLGAPSYEPSTLDTDGSSKGGGCRAFLKVYESLIPVYTSGVYTVCGGTRQFTVNVASERQRRGLQLRGDILLKCYHRDYRESPNSSPGGGRELIFSCQFHTCAVTDYTLSFTRQELDFACNDLRFPLDGAVELHFSPTPEIRLPSPAPTPAVPVHITDDPISRWDSYENLGVVDSPLNMDSDEDEDEEVNHTFGPLDGSLYATVTKKQEASGSSGSGGESAPGPAVIGSPHTVSMDSGISSAGNGLLHQAAGAKTSGGPGGSNNTSHASSSASPPLHCNGHHHATTASHQSPSTPATTPLSPEERHRALDELLNDMLQTVENIPDLPPSASTSPFGHRNFATTSTSSTAHAPFDDLHPCNRNDVTGGNLPPPSRSVSYSSSHHKQLNNGYGNGDTVAGGSGVQYEDLDVHFIDDAETEDNIPYHARQDSRPFTYGVLPQAGQQSGGTMLQMHPGLASPSLVRKASFKSSTSGTLPRGSPLDSLSSTATLRRSPPRDFVDGELSPPRDYRMNNGSGSTSPRSPEFHDGHIVAGTGITSSNSSTLTWLQRQQQKLRERKELQNRNDRYPSENRLISELRNIQHHSYNRVYRPSASHRADGYTSDTTHFADDDDEDFTIPLHINTATSPTHKINSVGSAPASPLLPNRSSSRRFYGGSQTQNYPMMNNTSTPNRQRSDTSFERERPFVAVKRAHEQTRKYIDAQVREDSFSSWRTTPASDELGSPPRSSSPRPQTPAFPVHPRTPYVNSSSQQFDLNSSSSTGLPPKSPTTQRKLSFSGSLKSLRKWPSNSSVSSKDRSPSPVSDSPQPGNQNISIISNSSIGVGRLPSTPHSSSGFSDAYLQQSPKSPIMTNGSTGQSSPTVYYGHSRRSSIHSNSEPPQEVSPAHVKFVRDTSRFWYKPTISREDAINMLRDQPPGTFIVRDSNSFPGAFGLALKVATPPPNVQGKVSNSNDPASELVRHFLIEPTSRGVRLKGCSNEPVFSSLSALVYQHSLIQMALPCRLLLPEGDGTKLPPESPSSVSTAQLLLQQGAACNVLYLFTLDVESLTGPQAIKKAVQVMFQVKPLPQATVVHFKVSGQGITLTDNKRQLFFRRHYPVNTISYCGLDPDDHRWSQKNEETGMPVSSNRCFGFVARKPASKTDNQCHIFAELEPEQPASAIVNFVSKVMMSGGTIKANIV